MLSRIEQVRQEIAAARDHDPTAAYQARLAQIKGDTGGGLVGGFGLGGTPAAAATGDYAQFDNPAGSDRWRIDAQVHAPRSPFILRAGFVVPAMLISAINSDLPGQIVAQVAQNVFDTATGRYRLIPQGARLVGKYSSEVSYGQARVLVAWQRIVFPDGKAMDIGAMPGADGVGKAGFRDQVNNHYFRIFSSAFLMSAITAGVAYSQNRKGDHLAADQDRTWTMEDEMGRALGQQLGKTAARMLAKNLNIAPTLQIRPGYRFNILVTKDLAFPGPYWP